MSLSPLKQRSAEDSDHKDAPEQSSLISMGVEGTSSSGESILPSNVDVLDSCGRIFSSTPICRNTPRRRLFTSESCSPTSEAKLNGRICATDLSRLNSPIKLVVDKLQEVMKISEVEASLSLQRHLEELPESINGLLAEVEVVVKSLDRQTTCHENDLENLHQDLYNTKRELELKERANTSLEKQNQTLSKENNDLKKTNEILLNANTKKSTQLSRAKELFGRETSIEILQESAQVNVSQLVRESSLLKKEMGMLNNEFKRTSRSQETKNLGIQTEDMGGLEEGAESNLRHEVEDLKKMIVILSEKNKELTLNNSFLEEKVKLLESKSEASQFNSTEINLFREIEEDDQQQIGTLEGLTQMGINSEFNSETTVPIKNEELSSATQDFARNTNGPARLTEELENKKLIHENQSLNAKTQAQLEKLQKDSDAKTKEFESAKAQLEWERDSASENLTQEQRKTSQLNDQVGTLTEELDRIKAQLKEKEEEISELNGQATQLIKKEKALDDANKKVSKLEYETLNQQASINDLTKERDQLASEVTQLTNEKNESNNTIKKLGDAKAQVEQKLYQAEQNARTLVDQLNEQNSQVDELNKQLAEKAKEISKLSNQLTPLTQEKSQLEESLSSIKQDLAAKTKELENTDQKVLKLEQEKLSQQASIDNLTCKVTTLTDENTQLQNGLKSTQESLDKKDSQIGNLNSQLKDKGGQFKELNDKLESKSKELNDIQEQLENKSELENQVKELSGKNKKFSEASTHGKRQGNYASVSFVLSGAFAVGASLTMSHLAICISLAVAALTFLAVGCYCSYKANTALSDVGIDQINDFNPPSVGV